MPPKVVYHIGYFWQDGLRFGFGHEVILSQGVILTTQQEDEVAEKLKGTPKLQALELSENATVALINLFPIGQHQSQVQAPSLVMPAGVKLRS